MTVASADMFARVFAIVVGEEGGYSAEPADPGNWTGGTPGRGECRGTKFGIAASSHPDLDIATLTLDQARALYRSEYWDPLAADDLPPPLALLVFDAGVNCGIGRAARWLQAAVGVPADGRIGPATLTAVAARAGEGATLLAEFQALRLTYMAALPTWRSFGLGWARRLCRLPFDSVQMTR